MRLTEAQSVSSGYRTGWTSRLRQSSDRNTSTKHKYESAEVNKKIETITRQLTELKRSRWKLNQRSFVSQYRI